MRHGAVLPGAVLDELTRSFNSIKEETKGHALDLTDMAEAARTSLKSLQDVTKKHNVDDAKFKGKVMTVSASLKAYSSRLSNLQSEARALQNDVDALVKSLWITDESKEPTVRAPKVTEVNDDFVVEPPKEPQQAQSSFFNPAENKTAEANSSQQPEELVVEVESAPSEPTAQPEQSSPEDDMSITDITRELHEKNIDFSDCLTAKALRQRYRDVKDGKLKPRAPPPEDRHTSASKYQQEPSRKANVSETALAHDPNPDGQRKMIDPMKFIWEVKEEIAKENNVPASNIDMWANKVRLEDSKRFNEYPGLNYARIEVRQKGDIPR